MRILYLAGRELNYTRNNVLLRAFQRLGTVEVVGEIGPSSILLRSLRIALKALPHLLKNHYDLIFVGFYGQLLMLPIGVLSRYPILFDAFVSTYDTMCFDRRLFTPNSLRGRLSFWLDRTSCNFANQILLDTPYQIDYFTQTFNLSAERFNFLPVGCNEDIFYPRQTSPRNGVTQVLYYSSYLPLHGVEVVVQAAALLSSHPIHFRLIGAGQEYNKVHQLATELKLKNITFTPYIPLETLAEEINAADICLGGHFGSSDKASRVIPGKIYQILAMARPLIAADTLANRDLLDHGKTVYLCPPDDTAALASAILTLRQDAALRDYLAANGRDLYLERCSEAVITGRLGHITHQIIGEQ